jgi:hypothetical protein
MKPFALAPTTTNGLTKRAKRVGVAAVKGIYGSREAKLLALAYLPKMR